MNRQFLLLLAILVLFAVDARAQDMPHGGFKPDDKVMFDVSAEDWVTTNTAHVAIAIEAAVTSNTAGAIRGDMNKAVDDLAKADWRLTSFDRNQDQTGMERWSATFEARLPENELGGLAENAKKLSKAGMQLSVASIDFTPTLEEMEAVRSSLRTQIYKIASDQLAALNTAIPGRSYRIAVVNFTGDDDSQPLPRVMHGRSGVATMMAVAPMPAEAPSAPMERAQKVSLTARIVFAASPAESGRAPASVVPPAPPDLKR